MNLWAYIVRRLLLALPTLLVVSILGFSLMRFDLRFGPVSLPLGPNGAAVQVLPAVHWANPINPLAALKNNPQISAQALKQETQRLGLDRPLPEQYGRWLASVFQFRNGLWTPDLGKTFSGDDVATVLSRRAGNTLLLNVVTLLITWLVALPLGVWAALRWRTLGDRMMTALSAIGMSVPGFVLALLLAVVAVRTGWLPLGGLTSDDFATLPFYAQAWDLARHLALPVLVLTVGGIAGLQRQMRGNLLEVLEAEYIRTARAKGLPERVVLYKHAVRTAINPLVTLMGYEFAALLGGSVLVETVLGYPGLGALTYQAVIQTDTNLVMASLILSATMLVLGNLLADILLTVVDPRIELGS